MPASRELVAFAYIHDIFTETGDIAAGLAPLFKPIVAPRSGSRFEPEEFATAVTAFYGLPMHPKAAEFFAEKMASHGLLEKTSTGGYATYTYNPVDTDAGVSADDFDELYRKFSEFSGDRLQRHGAPSDAETVQAALNDYLRRAHFFDIAGTSNYGNGNGNGNGATHASVEGTLNTQIYDYLCSAFAEHLYHTDQAAFQTLRRLISGLLIAEVIFSLQAPTKRTALRGLHVFLDAPILLFLLDLSNEENVRHTKSLVAHLRDQEVQLSIFRHHLDEARQSLSAVLGRITGRSGETPYGPLSRRLLHDSALQQHARTVLHDLEGYVRTERIRIADALEPSSVGVKTPFTQEDESWLANNIGEYEKSHAKLNDAKAIAGIIRLRQNLQKRDLISAQYVFVTENTRLAKMSYNHLRRQGYIKETVAAPPCVTTRFLAGVMWLTIGGNAGGDLTETQLLANCAQATIPSDSLVEKVRAHLSSYRPEQVQYFEALMTDERAAHALMDQTLGDEEFVTENNILEIYEEVVRAAGEEVRQIKDKEIDDIRTELERERQKTHDLQQLTRDLQEQGKRALLSDLQRIVSEGKRSADRLRIAIFSGCVLLGIVLSFPELATLVTGGGLAPTTESAWRTFGSVVLLVFGGAQFSFRIDHAPLNLARKWGFRTVQKRLTELHEPVDLDNIDIDWERWRVKGLKS